MTCFQYLLFDNKCEFLFFDKHIYGASFLKIPTYTVASFIWPYKALYMEPITFTHVYTFV